MKGVNECGSKSTCQQISFFYWMDLALKHLESFIKMRVQKDFKLLKLTGYQSS